MNRILLVIILSAVLPVSGCQPLLDYSSSSFLTNFSLAELVQKNGSAAGKICAQGAMGGGGGTMSGRSRAQSYSTKSSSFSCQTGAGAFDDAALVASLRADVEAEIIRSGAKVISQGSSDPAQFYFEYGEGKIRGRISVVGKQSAEKYYSLEAKLEEKSEASK